MSSRMPPVPPANRSKKGPKRTPEVSKDEKLVKHEHHANSAEEGDTAILSRTPRTRVTSAAGGNPSRVPFSRRHGRSIYDTCRNDRCTPNNHA